MRGNPKCNYVFSVWPDTCWIKRKCHMFRNHLKEKWWGKKQRMLSEMLLLDSPPFMFACQLNQSRDQSTNHLSALNTTGNTLWSTGVINRCRWDYCFWALTCPRFLSCSKCYVYHGPPQPRSPSCGVCHDCIHQVNVFEEWGLYSSKQMNPDNIYTIQWTTHASSARHCVSEDTDFSRTPLNLNLKFKVTAYRGREPGSLKISY